MLEQEPEKNLRRARTLTTESRGELQVEESDSAGVSIKNKTAESSSSFQSSVSADAGNDHKAKARRMTEFSEVVEAVKPSLIRRRGILINEPKLHLIAEQAMK